jgi:hypothetical protein
MSAQRYRNQLECGTEWMDPHYKLSRILRMLGMGHSALAGLPMAIVFDVGRLAKWALRLRRTARTAASTTHPSRIRLLKSTPPPEPAYITKDKSLEPSESIESGGLTL